MKVHLEFGAAHSAVVLEAQNDAEKAILHLVGDFDSATIHLHRPDNWDAVRYFGQSESNGFTGKVTLTLGHGDKDAKAPEKFPTGQKSPEGVP